MGGAAIRIDKNWQFMGLILIGGSTLGGCVTGSDTSNSVAPTHYTLQVGERVPHPAPLPDETKILVKQHGQDGAVLARAGFRGWDFNKDGRFEMVDVLNEDGSLQVRAFDFDGDGVIDEQKAAIKPKLAGRPAD